MTPCTGYRLLLALAVCGMVWCSTALANDPADTNVATSALAEARAILSLELFGHYDVAELQVQGIEHLRSETTSLGRDYALVKVRLKFSTARNTTKHSELNPDIFVPGSAMCQGWLYLHCAVPAGHVFDGMMEILLARAAGDGAWRAVSPHSRSRRQYPLDGYLLLEGRKKEGYVLR